MKKTLKGLSILLSVLVFVTSLPLLFTETVSAASDIVNVKVRGKVLYSYEYKVLSLINKERKKRNLSQLKMSQGLLNVANKRAAEISLYYSHKRANGDKNPFKMYKWKHYVGENIALNLQTPEQVVKCWMNSPAHKKNILNKKFRSVGIGCFKVNGSIYWEQFFVDNKASRNASQKSNVDVTYTIPVKTSNVKLFQTNKNIWIDDFYKTRVTAYQYNKSIQNYDFITNLYNACVKFESSNNDVVTVDSTGIITPVDDGRATITAYVKGLPSKTLTWNINVEIEGY